ncbi:peptidoglycan glycosyltransferase FtsI [Pseudoalteromonas tunicata]|uniref:Peptidoglycan D,D-transpeptidase FtsI n=1 Tax=Pseudoalteromonas tunicata D2 TaxID=87626 RepID=A4C8C1_9GAMM|nr:peptidoglycan glycosyltransferase FtsI [Pseudoalteromonas tunicata]ATC93341.1 cell division protein FtsI (penicillin-binding protein 3) [Pseudoalteromonas tunicata]AXT32391.1 peptidoglycan glycosyltransferase FtsI [Pseudoalteromonas tunicata]EAR28836.1 division-specific transpeptidase, penicillin-binding protein 3 [Pseudoalteromonas tunicata D2]MDP4983329.1 peptidoglycan glycosyltransferase FtsI [Pseudoalteromonas tunicata]MDP5213519.1 peptidoglycan glycosyltransferase FtsI [Pseudoalteromon
MTDGQRKKVASSFIAWRFFLVSIVIAAVFVALASRAAYIQILEPDMAIDENNKRTLRVEALHAQRGMIFDRHGKELAVSVPVVSVYADPKALEKSLQQKVLKLAKKQGENIDALQKNSTELAKRSAEIYHNDPRWRELAEVLQSPQNEINDRLRDDLSRRYVYLKRQITPAVANYIDNLNLPGIHLLDESKRYYPAGEVSAHVVGFTNIDGEGIEGIENLFDKALTGADGRRTVRKDAQGREIEVLDERERIEPENITLSIDQRIQGIAYKALKSAVLSFKATSGSAMVVDVKTGEILAMVNSPSFNPNNLADSAPHKRRNRAVTDLFEPGSTVKPLSVLAGLEYGSIAIDEVIDTHPGWMRVGGRLVTDPRNNKEMTLREILKKSSNMGVAKIVQTLPKDYLVRFFQKAGFGEDTGTNMVGESSGLYRPDRRWSDFEIATLSYGYAVSVSTAQLARVYATLGSGGISRPLTILKQEDPMPGERIMQEHNVKAVVQMMESVFEQGGTAPNVKVDGYRVAGKTGTSIKAVAGGYGDEYVGYFAGVGPVSDPRLAVVVMVNEPGGDVYYGGAVSGPAFAEIMSGALRMLNVAPDLETFATLDSESNDG